MSRPDVTAAQLNVSGYGEQAIATIDIGHWGQTGIEGTVLHAKFCTDSLKKAATHHDSHSQA